LLSCTSLTQKAVPANAGVVATGTQVVVTVAATEQACAHWVLLVHVGGRAGAVTMSGLRTPTGQVGRLVQQQWQTLWL